MGRQAGRGPSAPGLSLIWEEMALMSGFSASRLQGTVQGPFISGRTKASLVAQIVKNLSAMQETQVRSLGMKDPLEKGMATHFSSLAWRIPWTEEPRLQSMESQRVRHD